MDLQNICMYVYSIWAQMIHWSSHMVTLANPILGLEHQNGCIKPDMGILFSDSESAYQIGPDDIWFMSFRGGDLTISWCSKLICLQHRLQVSYADFMSRFWISSKNKSKYKLDHPKWSWSYFPVFTDLAILGATMGISNFPGQIWSRSPYPLLMP
jgi:hypothetical protein